MQTILLIVLVISVIVMYFNIRNIGKNVYNMRQDNRCFVDEIYNNFGTLDNKIECHKKDIIKNNMNLEDNVKKLILNGTYNNNRITDITNDIEEVNNSLKHIENSITKYGELVFTKINNVFTSQENKFYNVIDEIKNVNASLKIIDNNVTKFGELTYTRLNALFTKQEDKIVDIRNVIKDSNYNFSMLRHAFITHNEDVKNCLKVINDNTTKKPAKRKTKGSDNDIDTKTNDNK